MDQNDRILSAIDGFYAAALGQLAWEGALDRLLDATGFAGACLYAYDRSARDALSASRPPSAPGIWHRFDPSLRQRYEAEAYLYDPQRHVLIDRPSLRWRYDALHISEREMDRDPYYNLIEREAGFRYYIGGQSDRRRPVGCTITVHRPRKRGHADPHEIETFASLFGHVERALLVESRLGLGMEPESDGLELLEKRSTGIVILGGDGRVLFANRSARAFAERADAFVLGAEGIRAMRPSDDERLRRLVADTTALAQRAGNDAGVMRLPRKSGARDYVLVACPLPERTALFPHVIPATCVLITDPDAAPVQTVALLRQAYGLTPAEARFALQLALGNTPEQAGTALQISLSTARSHLAAIFRKTETSRQAELMRLLLALPWPVEGRDESGVR